MQIRSASIDVQTRGEHRETGGGPPPAPLPEPGLMSFGGAQVTLAEMRRDGKSDGGVTAISAGGGHVIAVQGRAL